MTGALTVASADFVSEAGRPPQHDGRALFPEVFDQLRLNIVGNADVDPLARVRQAVEARSRRRMSHYRHIAQRVRHHVLKGHATLRGADAAAREHGRRKDFFDKGDDYRGLRLWRVVPQLLPTRTPAFTGRLGEPQPRCTIFECY